MVNIFKRRKLFDDDADWVPQKGRAFKMKTKMQKEEPKEEPKEETTKKQDNIKTGAEGMDRAYAQGDVYGEGNKEYVAGSHTFTDWFDDFTQNSAMAIRATGTQPNR